MRSVVLVIFLAGGVFGQSLVEAGAAAAGGSVGGVAGKKVSDGLTAIFGKIDKQTAKAAQTDKPKAAKPDPIAVDRTPPLLTAGPGMVKRPESVPPPPPIHHAAVHRPPPIAQPVEVIEPAPAPPPPPPEVTSEDLKTVKQGMARETLLALGAPASRITMFDDGHLLEIYRYMDKENTLGVVRLSDGRVSTIEVR